MYAGYSGATCVYACCITDMVHICVKMCIFGSGMNKKGHFKFADGNGRPSKQVAWSEAKFVVTDAP
jgi:hypothetical protein